MIGPDRLSRVTAGAMVPEQVVAYVRAVAGSTPLMLGTCVGYASEGEAVLVGYPLHDPLDLSAMAAAVDEALALPGLRRLTVVGPALPPQAPPRCAPSADEYFGLPIPAPAPAPKLRSLLRRAGRELGVERGRELGAEHLALIRRTLETRGLAAGTRHIFERLPRYLESSPGSLALSARRADGRLAAFAVGEYAALGTAFFMFCFRDPQAAVPGSADLLLSGLLAEAHARGQARMNLGLGISPGIRFFKRKWGAEPFLPCIETSWDPRPPGLISRLRGMIR
jgi:hypothetical protein